MPCDHDHRDGTGHGGHRHFSPERLDRAMAIGVGLNAAFVLVEIAAGLWGGSLALVADAGHNAGDVVGLLLAWGASRLARRPPEAPAAPPARWPRPSPGRPGRVPRPAVAAETPRSPPWRPRPSPKAVAGQCLGRID